MSKEVKNLHKRRKRLGLSLLRYFHAFIKGYEDKKTKKTCPYKKEQESLTKAYWEGRNTRYNYDCLKQCDIKTKEILTPDRK